MCDVFVGEEEEMFTIQSNNISHTYEEIDALISFGIQNAKYLHTYHGKSYHFSYDDYNVDAIDWNVGVTRIIEQYDDVLEELATL